MHQELYQTLMLVFMCLAVVSAVAVIFAKNPIRSALSLVLTFILTACVWLLSEAEFLALILVLVYVGAVMTLFLFVVMMTNLDDVDIKKSLILWVPVSAIIVAFFIYMMSQFDLVTPFATHIKMATVSFSDTKALGKVIYTEHVLAFELAAVLLLVAIVSAIALAFKGVRPGTKHQSVRKQIQTKKADRLRIISMND